MSAYLIAALRGRAAAAATLAAVVAVVAAPPPAAATQPLPPAALVATAGVAGASGSKSNKVPPAGHREALLQGRAVTDDVVVELYERIDAEDRGYVTVARLREYLAGLTGGGTDVEQQDREVGRYDEDGNGILTFGEFGAWLRGKNLKQ